MEPRLFRRGNFLLRFDNARLHVASMGPDLFGPGYFTTVFSKDKNVELQWGRAAAGAETAAFG
jgi:hypothetical protein